MGYLKYCQGISEAKRDEYEKGLANVLDSLLSDNDKYTTISKVVDGSWVKKENKVHKEEVKAQAKANGLLVCDSAVMETAKAIREVLYENLNPYHRGIVFNGQKQGKMEWTHPTLGVNFVGYFDFLKDGHMIDLKCINPEDSRFATLPKNRWHWQAALYQKMTGCKKYSLLFANEIAPGLIDFDIVTVKQSTLDRAWEEMEKTLWEFILWGGDMAKAYSYTQKNRML